MTMSVGPLTSLPQIVAGGVNLARYQYACYYVINGRKDKSNITLHTCEITLARDSHFGPVRIRRGLIQTESSASAVASDRILIVIWPIILCLYLKTFFPALNWLQNTPCSLDVFWVLRALGGVC